MDQSVWTLPVVRAWMEWAERSQKEIQKELLGKREYDFFESTDQGKKLLREKISLAMCGPPKNENLSRDKEDERKITKIFNSICQQNAGQGSFRVSLLFISCLTREDRFYTPLICLHIPGKRAIFFDDSFRTYNGFKDYLENNRLPKCLMCFPESGSYYRAEKQIFTVGFRRSWACGDLQKAKEIGDTIAIVAGIGGVALRVGVATLAPGATALINVANTMTVYSATYSTVRSVQRLHDMHSHGESIGLDIEEARNCWLTIGSSVASAVSMGVGIAVEKYSAKMGNAQVINIVSNAPFQISLALSGLGVVNGVMNIVQKIVEGDSPTTMDCVYLASAIFLFWNVAVTHRQANQLIREVLARDNSTKNIFADLSNLVDDRTRLVEMLNSNATVQPYATVMYNIRRDTGEGFSDCFHRICKQIVKTIENLENSDMEKISKEIDSLTGGFWSRYIQEISEVIKKILKFVKIFMKCKGKDSMHEVFEKIPSEKQLTLANVLLIMKHWVKNQVSENGDEAEQITSQCLTDAIELQNQAGTSSVSQWIEELQRTCMLLKNEFERQKTIYQEKFETAKKFSPNLSESKFQEVEGITVPLKEYLWGKTRSQMQKDFSSEKSLLKLTKGMALNNPESSALVDPETGIAFYFYHSVKPAGSDHQLSREQYFSLVREKVGFELAKDAKLEIDCESRLAFFRDLPSNSEGVSCIFVQCVPGDGLVAGFILVVKGEGN